MTTRAPFKFSAHTRVGFSDTDALGIVLVTAHQTFVYVDLAERTTRAVPDDVRDNVLAFEGDDVER